MSLGGVSLALERPSRLLILPLILLVGGDVHLHVPRCICCLDGPFGHTGTKALDKVILILMSFQSQIG